MPRVRHSIPSSAGGAGSDTTAVHVLAYDTTGTTDGGTVLQAAYDAGQRTILIPPGRFKANSAVFFDGEDGMEHTRLLCDGVTFVAGSGLPTVSEWETFMSGHSLLAAQKWFLFPSTYRAALSAGSVTLTGQQVLGTASIGATKSGIHPHLVVDGGCWYAGGLTKNNAGMVMPNIGGATELRSVHMNEARCLIGAGVQYIDGNAARNCSAWSNNADATYDAAVFYQIGNGDGVRIEGTKTAGYIMTAKLWSCNGAVIDASIGGGFQLTECHGVHFRANHTETAANITNAPRIIIQATDSHFTYDGGFDYLANDATKAAIYLDDSGSEGKHSDVHLSNWFPRHFMDPATSDPVGGWAIYINTMNDRSSITVDNSQCHVSMSDSTFGQAYGPMGLPISGNAANESTLAAAIAAGRDLIGSGCFKIVKEATSALSTGQNQAMTIKVRQQGNLGPVYAARQRVTPTLYNNDTYGGAVGTLTNAQAYAYAAAEANTLPDGTLQYGPATAERLLTAGASLKLIQEVYLPSVAAAGGTLVVWRKTGTGVLSAPDRYIVLPVGRGATRLFDTGANLNKLPWLTSSIPVPNTVAASDHTGEFLYLNGVLLTPPNRVARTSDTATRSNANTGTTLTNDDTLALALLANRRYRVEMHLLVTSSGSTGDLKVDLSLPGGASGRIGALASQANNVAGFGAAPTTASPIALVTAGAGTGVSVGTLSGTFGVSFEAYIKTGTSGGTLTAQWAQATASAETIMLLEGSHMEAIPLG